MTIATPAKLKTHVKSTIPQSDKEKEGDEQYRKGQLAVAVATWEQALEVKAHPALQRKIIIGKQEVDRQRYEAAVDEARFSADAGDFHGARDIAQNAAELAINDIQKEGARKLLAEIDQKEQDSAKAKGMQQMMIALGVAVVFIIILALVLVKVLTSDDEPEKKPPPAPAAKTAPKT